MKYKILHIFGKLNRGGSETFIMNVLRNTDREQYQFDFLVHDIPNARHDYTAEVEKLGSKIYSVPSIFNFPLYLYSLFCLLKKTDHSIVHIHIHTLALFPLLFAKFFGKKVIVHSHNTRLGGGLLKKTAKYILTFPLSFLADYYCACSLDAGKWLFGPKINLKRNFSVIANGIDAKNFSYNEDLRDQYRTRLHLQDRLILGHVGRLDHQKNHDFLIDIFHAVYKQNKDAVLLLIGRGSLEEEIKNKVNKLGLSEVVRFLGVRNDIPALMNAMDIFVFPSLYEGLGIVLIEAQATGLPCLTSSTVPRDAKVTNLCSFLPLNDTEPWVDNCFKSYPERKSMEEEIKQSGYQIENSVEKLCTIYKDLKEQ